jgi:hypothetical protein
MKKNNQIRVLLLFFVSIILTSCSKSDSGESNGTSTGNYLPLAVNNSWKYLNAEQSLLNEVKITGTTQSGGTTYYEYTDDSEGSQPLPHSFAKKGATYFLKAGETTISESGFLISIKSYEIPILKDDYEINNNWTGTVSPKVTFSGNGQSGSLPFSASYTGTNLYKGDVTLNGIVYPNVIKTRINISINANGQITNTSEEFWFAENIGIIKDISTINGVSTIQDIYSYVLN